MNPLLLRTLVWLVFVVLAALQAWRFSDNTLKQWAFGTAAGAFALPALANVAFLLGVPTGSWVTGVLLVALVLLLVSLVLLVRSWQQGQGQGQEPSLLARISLPGWMLTTLELVALVVWTLFVTQPYLNMDPMVIPAGEEYLAAIQSHHLWTRMDTCGWCAWWNDGVRGGAPASVDMYGSMLHPLVAVTNVLWGVRNGTKIALVGAFLLGGFAQWWLASVLNVGRVARLWSAGMAVVAGHLAGRMELGTFGLVLSTASCALVLPPLILVNRTGSRRSAVLLGVTLALAALAGQGYLQVGLLATAPAVLLLLPHDWQQIARIGRRYLLAVVIALLLAAPFLVPFVHFLPQFGKHTVAELQGQPLTYVLLNLVVNDVAFFYEHSPALHKHIHPWLYINFVGWIPLFFVFWALRGARSASERWLSLYLLATAVIALWIASDGPLEALARAAPERVMTSLRSMRYYPVIAGLAVPPLLGIAAIGLDKLLQRPAWNGRFVLDVRWLLLIPLVFSLRAGWLFTSNWITVREMYPDVAPVLDALRTSEMQWVNTPHGQFRFVEPAVRQGLKVGNGIRPWEWRGRMDPEPLLWVNQPDQPPPRDMTQQDMVAGFALYAGTPAREYARVLHADGSATVCLARGKGGHIDVACSIRQQGILTVKENNWTGWQAMVDGESLALRDQRWLTVALPPGEHIVRFRYRPWDVPLGLGLCVLGIVLAGVAWFKGIGSGESGSNHEYHE
jgi:hypothetical protein